MPIGQSSPVLRIHQLGDLQLPDLVLLHGWGSCSAIWQPLLCEMQKHFYLHLLDLPFSLTDPQIVCRVWESDWLIEEFAKQLPETAIWCGWSLGGMLALAYAQACPARVRGVITLCSNPVFVANSDWCGGMQLDTFNGFLAGVETDTEKALKRFAALVSQGSVNALSDLKAYRDLCSSCLLPDRTSLIAGLKLLGAIDLRAALSQMSIPALMMYAQHDALVPVEAAAEVAALNPSLQVEVLEGASHIPWLSQPQPVLNQMKQFCREHNLLKLDCDV